MGRTYAGILGLLAMLAVVVRGLGKHAGIESTFGMAIVALFGFAMVGFVLGELAAWLVEDSVRSKVADEVAAAEAASAANPTQRRG